MAVEVHLQKSDNVPWGFRLTGGAEFEEPLTVVKVEEGSIAFHSGLQIGDLVVRLNETPTANLTHTEAHDVILNSGYDLIIGVRRDKGGFISPVIEQVTDSFQEGVENRSIEERLTREPKGLLEESIEEPKDDLNLTDEEIARIISGGPEVLTEQNFLRVEFAESAHTETIECEENQEKKWSTFLQKPNKPKPKPKWKDSDKPQAPPYRVVIKKQKKKGTEEKQETKKETNSVQEILLTLETQVAAELEEAGILLEEETEEGATKGATGLSEEGLTEEATEEDMEMMEKSRKMMKEAVKNTNRQLEMESRSESQTTVEMEGMHSQIHMESHVESQEVVLKEATHAVEEIIEKAEEESRSQSFLLGAELARTTKALEEQFSKLQTRQSSFVASNSIEEQLSQVQAQLIALSQLPVAIQQTLNAVTQQLEKIVVSASSEVEVSAFEASSTEVKDEVGMEVTMDEDVTYEEHTVTEEDLTEREITMDGSQGGLATLEEDTVKENMEHQSDITDNENAEKHRQDQTSEDVDADAELTEEEREERMLQRQKDAKLQKELEQLRGGQKRRPSDQRPVNPLTPLERPIILPGGRRWSQPGDACPKAKNPKMTDDKIASTLETFSEVNHWNNIWPWGDVDQPIYRSMLLANDVFRESNCCMVPSKVTQTKKINFLKYQPPPKKLDHLQRSEVYRMIHDMEPPARGIIARAGIVAAAEDYYEQKTD